MSDTELMKKRIIELLDDKITLTDELRDMRRELSQKDRLIGDKEKEVEELEKALKAENEWSQKVTYENKQLMERVKELEGTWRTKGVVKLEAQNKKLREALGEARDKGKQRGCVTCVEIGMIANKVLSPAEVCEHDYKNVNVCTKCGKPQKGINNE